MGRQALPGFPAERSRQDLRLQSAALCDRGIVLRAARDRDLPWLSELYASTRTEELAPVPWPEATKRSFLEHQFELQHKHFASHYVDTEFWIVDSVCGEIGRLYMQRADPANARPDDLIIDICFLPGWRNQGLGGLLMRAAQTSAAARDCGLSLHVQVQNQRALMFYERLGFVRCQTETHGSHLGMRWTTPSLS